MRYMQPLEIKRVSLETNEFEGYGAVFNNVDLGGDVILKGAFRKSLRERLPKMFWQHNADWVPGAWAEAKEDDNGLFMRGEFAATQLGQDTRTLVKMDAVGGLSIGYITRDFDFDSDGNRILKELEVHEVSVVSMPMNPEATITAAKSVYSPRTLERHLREVGRSGNEAKRIVHDVYGGRSGDGQREVGEARDEVMAKLDRAIAEERLLNLLKD